MWTIRRVSDLKNQFAPDGTAFDVVGPEDGQVVALIHGLGLSREIWHPHLDSFSASYRVVNYDLYGHGQSAAAPEEATLSIYAQQLAALLDYLQYPKAAVVGFSIGGMINRRFAMDFPAKLTALVILNSPHNRGEDAQVLVEARAARVREQGAMATMDDALKRWFTPDYLQQGAGADEVRAWRQQVDPESYAQAAWVLANGVRELVNPAKSIQAPTLVMTCENDSGSTPQMSRDIASEIDGATVSIVPRLQHLGLMQEPASFTSPIVKFLDETQA